MGKTKIIGSLLLCTTFVLVLITSYGNIKLLIQRGNDKGKGETHTSAENWQNMFLSKHMYDMYAYMLNVWKRQEEKIKEKKGLCFFFLPLGCDKNEISKESKEKKSQYSALIEKMNMNKVRKLSDDEENIELRPYVKRVDDNETIVNLFDYFVKGKKRINGKDEIFVNPENVLHRIVIICFKPTLNFSHIITQPSDALLKIIKVGEGEIFTQNEFPVLFYSDKTNWGLKNVLSTGIIEFFIPPFTRIVSDVVLRCANTEINETYTFEDSIQVRIRIPRSDSKIIGLSTDPKDREYFERIVEENVDEYEFGSYKEGVVGLKLEEDTELDPESCFKMVFEDDTKILLEIEYPFCRCINLDRPNFKLRLFYINDEHFEEEIQFSCSFTYKGKKKKAIFGESDRDALSDVHLLEEDKNEFQYFNGVPYKMCHFEYLDIDTDTLQVCERTIDEFSLFIYNCESVKNEQIQTEEPITTIKYLNGTKPLNKFTDIALFTKDIHIEHLKWKFPNYKYFMTSFINHGPHPLIIECFIPNPKGKTFQKVNILLHIRTNLLNKSVSFCDFKNSKLYDYLNTYIHGDVCEIEATSNTRFGFRCPDGTVKKPSKCFSQMYYLGDLHYLKDIFAKNIVIYSNRDESFALAAFTSSLSKSYTVECFCVQKKNIDKIEKRVIVHYVNEDQLYDYNSLPKVNHESVIAHPTKTHLCDFMHNNAVLKPTSKKSVNYICNVFPKPMEYIAMNCPTNRVDEENEKILSDLLYKYGTPGTKEKIRNFGKKRNNYSRSFHLPKDAPTYAINRYMQTVKDINEMIPGILIKDTVSIKIGRIRKTDAGVEDPSLDPDEKDPINEMYAKHIGLPNNIHYGLFIFQLPPFIKRNSIIEFACINDKTKKQGNKGNNGIMSVHLRSEGSEVHGCHFYKHKAENTILKKRIKVGSGVDCVVQSNGEIEYIGVACPIQSGLYLTPPGCFLKSYDSLDAPIEVTDHDKDFKNFTNNKGVSYLKIPQSFVGYLNIFCYCNEEPPLPSTEVTEKNIKKENKINIELNISNRGTPKVLKIDHLYEPDFLVGNEFLNRKPAPILRKKHICDFTRQESTLSPEEEAVSINSCFIELEENLSLIEVRCPRNVNPSSSTHLSSLQNMHHFRSVNGVMNSSFWYGKYRSGEEVEGERRRKKNGEKQLTEEELKKYEKIKYVPEEFDDVMHLNSKKKLEDILPGVIIFDRNRKFGEKGNFTFITPLIVQNNIMIKLLCDNSETVIDKKKGKKGIIVVKIPKHTTEKKFSGCDFSGNANKTFYYSEVQNLDSSNKMCEINLKENMIISLNCPNGKINPNNCFHNVYIKSTMDQENVENIENIFNHVKVINTNYMLKNSSAFLIISEMNNNNKNLNFYCTCEDYKSKNVGTIYLKHHIKSSSITQESFSDLNKKTLILDVPPYYSKDTYVCDFTQNHYNILQRSSLNMDEILKKYLDDILHYEHDEFTHFSLNLKLRKEILKKQYIEYVKKQMKHYRENPTNISDYPDHTIVYKCNIDLSAFDKFAIKCPWKESTTTNKGSLQGVQERIDHTSAPRLKYTSSLGNNLTSMIKGLNNLLFGTLIVNKTNERNVSFFERGGELGLIISPYADSSKNLSFSCENLGENGTKNIIIGFASIFIKKNDNKILGCDFLDPSDVNNNRLPTGTMTTHEGSHNGSVYIPYRNNSFEFEMELVEGKNIYCNIEAIENDVVGFSCPHNFLTSPEDCFESVQIEGLDKELETHKLEKLLKGVQILKNKIYEYNYTPSYIILPKKIKKSLKIFCTCNSIKSIKTGIIQINVIGDDLNNWFKKEITHNIYAFEKPYYFYDFSSGPLNISSENVLDISTLAIPRDAVSNGFRGSNQHLQHHLVEKSSNKSEDGKAESDLNGGGTTHAHVSLSAPASAKKGTDQQTVFLHEEDEEDEEDGEDGEDEEDGEDGEDGVEEENILNPMRTKQVHEITVAASEFSVVKIVCPLRNSQHFRQSKISPENFFEYVYVMEKDEKKKNVRSREEKERLITQLVQGSRKDANVEKSDGRRDSYDKMKQGERKENEEKKIEYDELGNKIIISMKTERPKATIEEDGMRIHDQKQLLNDKRDILIIKNINDVISFVNWEREISENSYIGAIHFSPLLLKEANFFISCDNSLTLNENRRGKTGIVKIIVKPNYAKILGCDFVGDYSSHFSISKKWKEVPKSYVCEVQVEDDSIIGLACPENTKLHPSDCFESVIKDNEVHKRDSIIESINLFLYKHTNKPILTFIQIKRVFATHFICKCYDTGNGDYKEVTIKINYEPYVLGTPKKTLSSAVIQYSDIDLRKSTPQRS
ncbi:6-cysteine protein [Plasmodium gonderi]|uniref:6-cysteine protein n=1 Tax=Plasmodium gonderi TaxID=77519 RepID=A0A1Y1JCV7_PLAGO|nr:6-cysteine protein [Plasmodium gonderi]GAW79518.1 6-cysteine protein [Plasmodium gonderi]